MKCIRCGHDSNYRDRSDGKCPECRRIFAFEPRTGDPFTDQAFKNAIERVSSDGSVKFTRRNLFYEIDRLQRRGAGTVAGAVAWLAVGATCIAIGVAASAPLIFVGAALFVIGAVKFPRGDSKHVNLAWSKFEGYLTRWTNAHGAPAGLFTPRTDKALPAGARAAALRAELTQYSFDRAVITDTDETADLLLANNFHFENNCAVLSVGGHPAHAFATVREMLRNNPKIEVYVLHDCTPEGCELAWTLRHDPAWFQGIGQVFDVALRPAQARQMKAGWRPGAAVVAEHPAISEDERRFLVDHAVELAAIRPEQLVKRLFRAMTMLPAVAAATGGDSGGGGDSGDADGILIWASDATASDGGGDSFG